MKRRLSPSATPTERPEKKVKKASQLRTIPAYGFYTVPKIIEFMTSTLAFNDEVLLSILNEFVNPSSKYNLQMIFSSNPDDKSVWKSITSIKDLDRTAAGRIKNNNYTSFDLSYLFEELPGPEAFILYDADKKLLLDTANTNIIPATGTVWYPTVLPAIAKEGWMSVDMNQASGFIRTIATRKQLIGPIFMHKLTLKPNLRIVNLSSADIQHFLKSFGVTEVMNTVYVDSVCKYFLDYLNFVAHSFKYESFDGVFHADLAGSLYLSNIPNSTIVENMSVYANATGSTTPNVTSSKSDAIKKTVTAQFFDAPPLIINSPSGRYRARLEELMRMWIETGKGLDPSKVGLDILSVIQSVITNAIRPYIYQAIAKLNVSMEDYGKFVVAGGDAINLTVDVQDRTVSPDIDTKFVLRYDKYGLFNKFVQEGPQPKDLEIEYFYDLTEAKNHLWYYALTKLLNEWNSDPFYESIYYSLLQPLLPHDVMQIFGVSFIPPNKMANGTSVFRKRLTLMTKTSFKDPNFLFDIELFGIDMFLESAYLIDWTEIKGETIWLPSISYTTDDDGGLSVAGILDMPFTKPTHLGYELGSSHYSTTVIIDGQASDSTNFGIRTALNVVDGIAAEIAQGNLPPINKLKLPVANIAYIRHDVEILHKLELRKGTKIEKDKRRLAMLARYEATKTSFDTYEDGLTQQEMQNDVTAVHGGYGSKGMIVDMRLPKILSFIAIPNMFPNGEPNPSGFISCEGMTDFEVRFDTHNRFNYIKGEKGSWVECCDVISNQFAFRFHGKKLNMWAINETQHRQVICILKGLDGYVKSIISSKSDDIKALKLGAMVYGFKSHYLSSPKFSNPRKVIQLLAQSVLMVANGFSDKYADKEVDTLTKSVYRNLERLSGL